jgi:hypothetical protein
VLTKVVRPKNELDQFVAIRDGSSKELQRTSARGTADHQAELDTLLDILLSADLDLERAYGQYRH